MTREKKTTLTLLIIVAALTCAFYARHFIRLAAEKDGETDAVVYMNESLIPEWADPGQTKEAAARYAAPGSTVYFLTAGDDECFYFTTDEPDAPLYECSGTEGKISVVYVGSERERDAGNDTRKTYGEVMEGER